MKAFGSYLFIEMKRLGKALPLFAAGAVTLAAMLAVIALLVSGGWYQDKLTERFSVGVVCPEGDKLTERVMSMLSSMDSVESICDFVYVDEDEGRRRLEQGSIGALLLIPEGLAEGIMDGTNTPAKVLLRDGSEIPEQIFRELTRAGMRLLSTAQAGIYAVDDYSRAHELTEWIPHAEEVLNREYLRYALNRSGLFKNMTVSASGDLPMREYYVLAAVLLWMFWISFPLLKFLCPQQQVLSTKLKQCGIGRWKQILAKLLCMTVLLVTVSCAAATAAHVRGLIVLTPVRFGMLALLAADVAAITLFLSQAGGRPVIAGMLLLLAVTGMMFVSGALIPSVFLPSGIRACSGAMPTTWILDNMKLFLRTAGGPVHVMPLLCTIPVCCVLSVSARRV